MSIVRDRGAYTPDANGLSKQPHNLGQVLSSGCEPHSKGHSHDQRHLQSFLQPPAKEATVSTHNLYGGPDTQYGRLQIRGGVKTHFGDASHESSAAGPLSSFGQL